MKNYIRLLFISLCVSITTQYASADIDGKTALEWTLYYEITINRPADEVWNDLINLDTWIITHHLERFSGEKNKKGEIWKVTPAGYLDIPESERPPRSFHFGESIRVEPGQHFLQKGFAPEGSYNGALEAIDFVDFRLKEKHGKTTITLNGVGVVKPTPTLSQVEADQMSQGSLGSMIVNLKNLKKIVENRRR